jgi:chorismate mutase/prephenate dehydrogenase
MDIARLRSELADVDRQILQLVAHRQKLAQDVGRAKDRDDHALRDFAQEKDVLERARSVAEELGISARVTEALMQTLIAYSLTLQERQRVVARGGGGGRRALVIGGSGRMGWWFSRFLMSQGFAVEVADPLPPPAELPHIADWHASPLDHDLIVVATELRTTEGILRDLARRKPHGVVFDIGSLKSPLKHALHDLAAAGVDVASIHPMFGPDTELLSGRHVILIDLGHSRATKEVRALFGSTMAEVVTMDLEDHDRVVAYVLGLSHALSIAFFTALLESGKTAGQLARLSSTTFDRQLAVAHGVAQENPHLYYEIQHLNDYGPEPLAALEHAVQQLRTAVQDGDEAGFVAMMERGKAYLVTRSSSAAPGEV